MIARSVQKAETGDWVAALRQAWRDPLALLAALGVEVAATGYIPGAGADFAFRVPRPFAQRMRRGDPHDPLLRQVLPHGAEAQVAPGFGADPVGDLAAARAPALLHKYHGRVLLLLTGACAVNCRYCFRREYPYAESVGQPQVARALREIASDPSITEIILSGGDPLMWHDDQLVPLIAQIAAIPHVQRLRLHTRLPVVIPARITTSLLTLLGQTRLRVVLVLHVNHAQEIDAALARACTSLRHAGVTLLNQAVLLAGVNDDADALTALSLALFDAGVLPYYLHLLDRVRGAAHFEVPEARAQALWQGIAARLPGYLVPRLVREVAGAAYKLPVA